MKIFVDSIGCRLNQSEIEKIAAQFDASGHELVNNPGGADLVVINTCAVTGRAVADSRRSIRQAAAAGSRVVATGCWASLEPEQVLALAENTQAISNSEKSTLVQQVLNNGSPAATATILEARSPLPGPRFRTRAFIKVQDGCDQHCTFCITRIARGRAHSIPVADVLADVAWASSGGAQEIVLTGVNLGSWGQEWHPSQRLEHLVRRILADTGVPRVRLSSIEPWGLGETFFALWKDRRVCPQLHLPLQSGSDAVLKRMGRQTDRVQYRQLLSMARSVEPGIAISTDLIVGFPGETEEQFEESLAFVNECGFSAGHVFAYSPRPGTPAVNLLGRIPVEVVRERSQRMRALLNDLGMQLRRRLLGQVVDVLWEGGERKPDGGWLLRGTSGHGLAVEAEADENRWNQMDRVCLVEAGEHTLAGRILSE